MCSVRMTDLSCHAEEARRHVERAVRRVSPFLEHFARFGFAAKGVVYFIIGLLAALAPLGLSDRPTWTRGALSMLLRQPTGSLLLAAAAAGLLCFGLFQLFRGIEDYDGVGSGIVALGKRVGWIGNAFIHFALVAAAISMMIGYRRAADDDAAVRDWTAIAMAYPLGRWLIAGIAVGIFAYGVQQLIAALRGKLDRRLSFAEVTEKARCWLGGISRFGIAARGMVFCFLGWFLIRAAYDANAHEARGMGGTLREIAGEPYGRWLLCLTALGLIAYGFYDFVLARYRRITINALP